MNEDSNGISLLAWSGGPAAPLATGSSIGSTQADLPQPASREQDLQVGREQG